MNLVPLAGRVRAVRDDRGSRGRYGSASWGYSPSCSRVRPRQGGWPSELALQVAGTRLLCENLAGLGILEQDGHTFSLAKRSRKWLDPASDTYLGTWVEHSVTYWEWYGDLERVVRDGGSFEIHREPAEDEEYWRVYITGQYEIARLSSAEVAKAIRLAREAHVAARRGRRPRVVLGRAVQAPRDPEGHRR